MGNKIIAYKGFNEDMTCRGFQFEEGKTYHEDSAELCKSGFHACEDPLDCFKYYEPNKSVYHEVELEDVCGERKDDSKICGKTIKIGARLSVARICELHFEYVKKAIVDSKSNTGYRSAASNTGDYSAASNTGNFSAASNTGDYSAASNTGNFSAASNTGDYSAASVSGTGSVALVTGYKSKAKAAVGSAICICERGDWDGDTYPLLGIKAAIIDGETLKPDTWYKLENGEFVEVEENV